MAEKHGKSRFLGGRWRSRSNADETQGDQSKNLADFLSTADTFSPGTEAPTPASLASRARPGPPQAPKIDITAAQRWAGSGTNDGGAMTPSSMAQGGMGGERRAKKQPRRPNLKVSFNDVPHVMGEGGDECEDPTMMISIQRWDPPGPIPPTPSPTHAQSGWADEDDFDPPVLRRTQTGMNRSESVNSSHHSEETPEVDGRIQKMRQEEGATLHQLYRRSLIDPQGLEKENIPATVTGAATLQVPGAHLAPQALSASQSPPTMVPYKPYSPIIDESRSSSRSNTSPVVPAFHKPYVTLQQSYKQQQQQQQQQQRQSYEQQPQQQSYQPQQRQSYEQSQPQQQQQQQYQQRQEQPQEKEEEQQQQQPYQQPPLPQQSSPPQQPSQSNTGARENLDSPRAIPYRNGPAPATALPYPPGPGLNKSQSVRAPPSSAPLSTSNHLSRASTSTARYGDHPGTGFSQSPRGFGDFKSSVNVLSAVARMKNSSAAAAKSALDDFGARCEHMRGIFRLQGEFERPLMDYTATQWLRAASWWFIKGRAGMESIIRGRPKSTEGQRQDGLLTQPHVDVAKAWWIMTDVIPAHPSLPEYSDSSYADRAAASLAMNDSINAEFFDSCELLMQNMKGLLSSMNRNNAMPPRNALIQGQDQTVWVKYPQFAPEILPVLTGMNPTSMKELGPGFSFNPLSVMALADTRADFSYYKWFIKATLYAERDKRDQISMPALFSLMRTRNEWHPKVCICTQREFLTICITGDRKFGPSWEDVKWSESDFAIQVRLPHGYIVNAQLAEPEYRILAAMYKKAFSVQTSLLPKDNEQVLSELYLEDFQFSDTMRPPAFPLERIRRCKVRLFAKSEMITDGPTQRQFYRGTRILLATSPKNRTLADVSLELDTQTPTILEMFNEDMPEGGALPALKLHIKQEHRLISLHMVFAQPQERQMLYSSLTQMEMTKDEMESARVRLKKLSIEPTTDVDMYPKAGQNPLGRMQWQEIMVLNENTHDAEDVGHTIYSSSLRIVAQGTGGTIVDRINLAPGELRLKIASDGTPTITILRNPQDDLTMAFDRRVAPFTPDIVEELHRVIHMQLTKRTFSFFHPDDMHVIQRAITGYTVKFDDLARDFTISRRRAVGALSTKAKKLEAGLTRLQVVSYNNDRIVQVLAFFDERFFEHASSMAFVVNEAEGFEKCEGKQSGMRSKVGVRFIEAKFALPKSPGKGFKIDEVGKGFLSLDQPEPPTDNDDIWIGFDEVKERDDFMAALPTLAASRSSVLSKSSIRGRKG